MIRDTGFEQVLRKLIDEDKPYVGSSAGSMVLSTAQDAA